MTNGQYTPGPWFCVKNFICARRGIYDVVIATIHDDISDGSLFADEIPANRRLIAAAPDYDMAAVALLTALQPFCDWDDGCLYVNGRAAPELALEQAKPMLVGASIS